MRGGIGSAYSSSRQELWRLTTTLAHLHVSRLRTKQSTLHHLQNVSAAPAREAQPQAMHTLVT
jgi:hypothetical protein